MCQGLQEITSHISVREHRREKYVYYDALMFMIYYVTVWQWDFPWMWTVKVLILRHIGLHQNISTVLYIFLYRTHNEPFDYCTALYHITFITLPAAEWDSECHISNKGNTKAEYDYVDFLGNLSCVCGTCVAHISSIMCLCVLQLIQLLSAVDPDEPVEGHHFYFSMVPEKHINPNFTIRDNQGYIQLDN